MAAFLDVCRFNPVAGGTGDFVYSSTVTGYQSPSQANAVNGRLYKYRAESSNLTQWEIGEGAYNSGTGTIARTTVLYNSSGSGTLQGGGGTKINFSSTPQVAVVVLSVDLENGVTFSEVSYASKFGISTATVTNVQSISAPSAGNYIVFGNIGFETAGGGVQNEIHCDNGLISATLDTAPGKGSTHGYHVTYLANQGQVITQGARIYTLTAGQTVYQHAYTSFTPGTCSVYGYFFMMKVVG